jgi:hypothetical protein
MYAVVSALERPRGIEHYETIRTERRGRVGGQPPRRLHAPESVRKTVEAVRLEQAPVLPRCARWCSVLRREHLARALRRPCDEVWTFAPGPVGSRRRLETLAPNVAACLSTPPPRVPRRCSRAEHLLAVVLSASKNPLLVITTMSFIRRIARKRVVRQLVLATPRR